MSIVRLGAVSYLNTKPLVYGLEQRSDLFTVRFDVPAQCAALLHEGRVDLGLIPAIEYLRGDYRIVPGIAIGWMERLHRSRCSARFRLNGLRRWRSTSVRGRPWR
jgi:chorismate dehydratase